jgi:hypothetical protein
MQYQTMFSNGKSKTMCIYAISVHDPIIMQHGVYMGLVQTAIIDVRICGGQEKGALSWSDYFHLDMFFHS